MEKTINEIEVLLGIMNNQQEVGLALSKGGSFLGALKILKG